VNLERFFGHLLTYLGLVFLLFYIIFPIYWMLLSSFKSPGNLFTVEYWPQNPTLINYRIIRLNDNLLYGLYNSIIVSLTVLILTLAIGSLAAYALGRLKFRGRSLVRYAILAMTAFPHIAIVGGLYLLVTNPCAIVGADCTQFQLYNTRWALIITYLILTLPLTIWFLANYYQSLPVELEEAAYVDGASPFQSFRLIFLPLSTPGLITTGLLSFIVSWNEFLFALTFTIDQSSQTAPVALTRYSWGRATFGLAAAFFITVPVLILALNFQQQITSGLTGLIGAGETKARPARRGWEHWLTRLKMKSLWAKLEPFLLDLSPAEKIWLGVALLALFSFFYYGWSVVAFPYPVDYGEGPLLDQVIRLANFQNIYRPDISRPPYTIANYPPLYLLFQLPFEWFFGPAYWYGRLISWFSLLAAALFVGLIVNELTSDKRAAIMGGVTLLAIPYASFWAPLARIDSLALGLSMAALFVVVRWPDKKWGVFATVALLTAAVYTRQSYGLAAPLAAFVWLFSRPPRYRAFILAAGVTVLGLSLFAGLNLLTQGGFFFHIVTANINKFSASSLNYYLEELWLLMAGGLIAAALFLFLGAWFRPKSWWLIGPYLVGAALSGLTIGKIGSNVNYLLELSAAVSLAIAALIAWQRARPMIYTGLTLLLALQLFLFLPGITNHWAIESKLDRRAELDQLMTVVRQANGPILADEYMGLLPLAGQPLYIQPFEVSQLVPAGLWDQKPFLEAIARREFAAILIFKVNSYPLEKERWTPQMLNQISKYYQPKLLFGEFFTVTVYYPKPD
jgi:trehalose/maltose transport system permease protein